LLIVERLIINSKFKKSNFFSNFEGRSPEIFVTRRTIPNQRGVALTLTWIFLTIKITELRPSNPIFANGDGRLDWRLAIGD